jgi:Protein of unknown function DUF2625.
MDRAGGSSRHAAVAAARMASLDRGIARMAALRFGQSTSLPFHSIGRPDAGRSSMKPLQDLIDHDDPAMPLVRQWLAEAERPFELLPPSSQRGDVLVGLQVTTRSPLGAIAYETGGLLIDHGWLRILGSGHPRLPRDVVGWNAGRASGHLLVADDLVGGFFAINGGALGDDPGAMYYFAPDTLRWEAMEIGYSDFLHWALSDRLAVFYEGLRWPGWEADAQQAGGHQCFSFFPFLSTEEGSVMHSSRALVDVAEQHALHAQLSGQLGRAE